MFNLYPRFGVALSGEAGYLRTLQLSDEQISEPINRTVFAVTALEAVTDVVEESQDDAVALDAVFPEQGTGDGMDILSVVLGECPAAKAFADVGPVGGMNVVSHANVIDDGHAGVAHLLQGEALSFLEFGPLVEDSGFGGGFAEVGELDKVEGEVVTPAFAPVLDHGGEDLRVLLSSPLVGLALLPDRPGNGVVGPRFDHAVGDGAGEVGIEGRFDGLSGATRIAGGLFVFGFRFRFLAYLSNRGIQFFHGSFVSGFGLRCIEGRLAFVPVRDERLGPAGE